MPKFLKVLIFFTVLILLYAAVAISIPYIRFFHIKDKMKEAAQNAMTENDDSIARALAENAMDDKIPLVGDYFYQVQDEKGNRDVYKPETEEQQREYLEGAREYFLQNIIRTEGQNYTISIDYTVELYFPFYTHRISFSHKESQPLVR
ncbi:MAG: hypothetical protein A2509_03850 [Candidatus Edwardsbacteria bacterium RIFOXYD12_FULL_50_11]|jgi:hypothetical protein|uniref:DUF4845 domain-containing protein n=1 Tax=Candidatus Edwardsbacteria bacterium GWF2_54_11 TaxID=1817851 RepID=A0A1F5R7N1_9BACT|nr:MAG: hypothetical protein A2502_05055 [Candidatus Edwardsbacteria bacterium RifOxyC12_full_54_24]OGF07824.1 MAG: hypothetical protein A2273_05010 [Candidatus Edwardsbacteria bacterium RifOxyA12_full_54_48]OGF10073.1 MAG: hypothetical protein A3K15_11425 [Candidatus Edwardsbacteria bacterium GWE2_54_12]OGF10460.1 MAG: hypothetical protein A2024_08890 [Candidatus Edwardsbacteria bacterium GWF2_54_11]OGF14985.1 MAG: hypothetical protein A2509_03850 [Candidatus Edwardsbacteria bacterium RIFOXYD1